MDKPRIADTRPARCRLEAGRTVYWCRCGRSRQQPFCDGSHAGTVFEPLAFTPEQDGEYFLCQCKRTARPPFCDGSHKRISQAELEEQAGFRTTWYRLAGADELRDGELRAVAAGQRALVLARIGDRHAALDARCPHRGGPLAEATLVRDAAGHCWLRCPWHGSDFDALTGRPAAGEGPAVATYPVELRADGIHVALREPLEPPASVADLLADTLCAWGLQQVCAAAAGDSALAAAFCQRAESGESGWLTLVDEPAAGVAAAIFSRLSGQAVACLGDTALWPGLREASAARVPVLAIAGRWPGQGRLPADSGSEIPILALPIEREATIADTLAEACRSAILRRGPVVLVVPDESLRRPLTKGRASPAAGRVCSSPMVPEPGALEQAARRLQAAQRPVIIVGEDVDMTTSRLVELAEILGAPILTSQASKGQVPETQPLAAGVLGRGGTPLAAWCLREADLLLLLGACPPELAGLDWLAAILQVHPEQQPLGAVRPFAQALRADPGHAVSLLADRLSSASGREEWRAAVAERRTAWRAARARRAEQAGHGRLEPASLFDCLSERLPADALLIVDLGPAVHQFTRYFECREQRILLPAADVATAFGLPAAMAAWTATQRVADLGGRRVVVLSSRACMVSQIAHFAAAARQAMRITLLVIDDPLLGRVNAGSEREPQPVSAPLARWAELCGATAWRVAAISDLASALRGALAADGPALVEIVGDLARG